MNAIRAFALAALFAAASSAQAAPRLVSPAPSFTPDTTPEVVFERPVAATADLGKPLPNTLLEVAPPLPGKLVWQSPSIARFVPDASPAMGVTYRFAVRADQRYLDGAPLPAGEFGTLKADSFTATIFGQISEQPAPGKPQAWMVGFNDAITPEKAAGFLVFRSGDNHTAPAVIGVPDVENHLLFDSWAERFARRNPAEAAAPPAAALTALRVTSVDHLEPGREWQLVIHKGCPNQDGTATVGQDIVFKLGLIPHFGVSKVEPVVTTEEPRYIRVKFTHKLPEELPAGFLEQCVEVAPRPGDLTATTSGNDLLLKGDFQSDKSFWVAIRPPFTSFIGLPLRAMGSSMVTFKHLEPDMGLPSEASAQLAEGGRTYQIQTVNISAVKVSIKQLTGIDAVRAYQGYRHYNGDGPDYESIASTAPLPYYLIGGKALLDKEFKIDKPVDQGNTLTLDWNAILPEGVRSATLFMQVVGNEHPGLGNGTPPKRINQAVIQLTDIGLAWKVSPSGSLIHAFSCATGQPLAGVTMELFGEDCGLLHTAVTDADGLARLPADAATRHLRASRGEDSFITAFDKDLPTVGMWHFPVPTTWRYLPTSRREVMMFTDRSLYRPGETMNLKGIVRVRENTRLRAETGGNPRLTITDPADKEIHTSPVTLSADGSFDLTYQLPPSQVGQHTVTLEWPDELREPDGQNEGEEDWQLREAREGNARFRIGVQVEEFRRNAFEVTQQFAAPPPGATTVDATVNARYYQGQPVAAGKVAGHASVSATNPYPENYRDFLFGNHRFEDSGYWHYYFRSRWEGYDDGESGYDDDAPQPGREVASQQVEATLSADGKASLGVPVPQAEFPTRHTVRLVTETTDSNNQTLTATSTVTVDPAAVYVGVSRVDALVRAGAELPLKLVAITPDGQACPDDIAVTATLTRQVHTTTKAQNGDGETSTRSVPHEEAVAEFTATIPANGAGCAVTVTPRQTGRHFLTIRGTDAAGRPFATVMGFHVYGTSDYPWLYEDGLRVRLEPEKTSYQPGETARILVLTPIEGKALVTVERETVMRSFVTDLKADQTVLEVPLTEDDAPNACVSVLIIKGARESARTRKEPLLRLGYCELKVANPRDRLNLTLRAEGPAYAGGLASTTPKDADIPTFRPGDEVTFSGTVTAADGTPAAGAEVTLYAEDEGTLAVMGYHTPDPHAFFNRPRYLQVETGINFESFIPENPEMRGFFNKGFAVGGGGDWGALADLLRRDFNPCATWAPALRTDAEGRFSHTFRLPDTLTRYRVIAVAHHQAARFGHAESAVIANKPLMLEPKAPRFANQGDVIKPQLLMQNATPHAGTWRVTYQAHAGSGPAVCRALADAEQTVTLAAGGSANLVFPSVLDTTGTAVCVWRADPVALSGAELTPVLARALADSVEVRFPVHYPVPLMRQVKTVALQGPGAGRNLLEDLGQSLLDGDGELDLEFATSNLLDAAGSIDFLLAYPHGCVEQTTSSLMPWFAVNTLRPFMPELARHPEEKVRTAIQKGADRLLAMHLPDGAFSYWPGTTERVDWAGSYAGLGLILAKQHGANVPDAAIERLKNHLITTLRGTGDAKADLTEQARTLWVLAVAGAPQPSYQNLLRDRLPDLTLAGRAFLALAIARGGQPADLTAARDILRAPDPKPGAGSWIPYDSADANQLLAWATIDPAAPETQRHLGSLLGARSPYGHWHNTWANGWSLLAVTAYAKSLQANASLTLTLHTADGAETIQLNGNTPTASRSLHLHPDLKAALDHNGTVFVRCRLAAKPRIAPQQAVAADGMTIDRIYEKIKPDGSAEILTQPAVGDLIKVTLRVTLPAGGTRYLVVEDPLPCLFETVSDRFESQRSAVAADPGRDNWHISHRELRDDRAVFYLDYVHAAGTYTVSYLARCTLAGEATAPQAKAELMYDSTKTALTNSRSFVTR